LALRVVVAAALTLIPAIGGCGGSGGLKPDGGTQVQLDATFAMDAAGPQTDATDAKVFDPGLRIGPPQATVVTAKVFASVYFGFVHWVAAGPDGAIFVGGTETIPANGMFYADGKPDLTLDRPNFVARLDRQGNTVWMFGYDDGEPGLIPAVVLPDGAIVLATRAGGPYFPAAVWRMEADGQRGWLRDFGANGPSFYAAMATREGDVILTGTAYPTDDLDPGPGTTFVPQTSPFLMKLSGATGEVLWLRTPVDAGWRPGGALERPDGRLVVRCWTSPGGADALVLLAADGTADPAGWLHVFEDALVAWTVLPSGDILAVLPPPSLDGPDDAIVQIIDGATGRRTLKEFVYYGSEMLVTGPSHIVGLLWDGMQTTRGDGIPYWRLAYWNAAGSLEGGLIFSPEPAGYGQVAAGMAVAPDDRIIVAATIMAPAGATVDLDPGPNVASFVTPNDYSQLAIFVIEP
jgi:hypothetical protein